MLNVQALRDTMAAMPLPRLQAYLRQHQDDPYTVALGLSIAKDKQKAILAQQGMAGQQPMPKVVDQEIAQVAPRAMPMPEDVGIGQLSADNLKGLCGGGIVAFDEGGAVPRYNGRDGVQMVYPGMLPMEGGTVLPTTSGYEGLSMLDALKSMGSSIGRRVEKYLGSEKENAARMYGGRSADMLEARRDRGADPFGYSEEAYPMPQGAPTATPPIAGGAQQTPPPGPTAPRPPAGPAAVAAGAAPAAGIPGLITTPEAMQKALADAQKGVTPEVPESLRGGIEDIQKTEQEALNRYVQSVRDEQAARQPAMKDFEERLKQREERLGRQERDLGPLAILQAGMAIMGGASPFAAVNVGAGAQVGIERYTKGAEKLEAARDKLDEAYGRIEEIRRNESRMDAKELREALLKAEQPAIEAKKTMFNALHEDFKLKRADASKGVELLIKTQMELYGQAEQTKRTGMMVEGQKAVAGMLPGEIRAAMLLGTGNTEAEKLQTGLPALLDLKDHMTDTKVAELYSKHVSDSKKDMTTPMTPKEFARYIKEVVGEYRPKVGDVPDNQMRTR